MAEGQIKNSVQIVKVLCAYLKGLSKYRRMAFFFLKYLFSF